MKVKITGRLFLSIALCTACAVQAQEQSDNKIRLSIGHFRPLEAEVNKFLRPIQRESIDAAPMPITAEERAILDSGTLTMLKTQEFFAKMQARKERMRKAEEEFRKQEEQIEKLRETMYKNAENRPLFNGMKKLCARLSQYDVFKILERNDMAELLNEAGAESGEKAAEVFSLARMASSYNVIVDVADLHRQEHRGNVGGVNFQDTIYTRDFIVKVQNMLDGSVALQATVKTKKKRTLTDVGATTDDGVVYEELVDDAVEQIAKAIYEKFVASCSFKFKPAGKIDGFEPSAITISVLDGRGEAVATPSDGETVEIRKGTYTFKVEGEYLFAGAKSTKKMVVSANKAFTETFEKAMQEVEFSFKAGGDAFPSVTLTPKGWEGEPVEISSAGPTEIRKGAYTFEATCDGFKDAKGSLNVTSSMKKYDFKMTKAPVAAPAASSDK